MNIVSVVKYKIKHGYEDAFIEAIKSYDYSKAMYSKLLVLGDNEFASISEYTTIDAIGDDEVTGLEWLDSVTHMLEFFDESRTQSYSGLVAFDTNEFDVN